MDPLTIGIVVGVVVVLGAGGYVFVLRRRRPKEEPVYHFNCPGCRRRLRYRAAQSGHAGQCPQCKRPLKFPTVPDPRQKSGSPRSK